ncbi:nitrate reductase cytochrome c-type subunit [Ferrimonas sp. SCSIO 43195]|uniref:nitrate reductase cytochrome c-type subunit n=1 Tax=Ferrimonas sp. SCSIO 43195 TaxID=2822844 RepID=UPI00207530C5|nr:nitrate reductase cytochrome c-type subunit [Ferrimonas sp. SCSIO 43195]USD38735.1 nitrate reductase cytochrome c-type subunit [Ferrimonas sp. SCSIO 43195]
MKAKIIMVAAAFIVAGCQMNAADAPQNEAKSRRGDTVVNTQVPAAEIANYPKKAVVADVFAGQPPLIPHKATYPINLKRNGCMSCHKPKKNTLPVSHTVEGKVKGNLYQCRVCHLPQADNVAAR